MRVTAPISGRARDAALERIRALLRGSSTDDFGSADDFADAVVDEIADAYGAQFSTARARAAVKRTTESIYRYYRLRDHSPFGGDDPPVKLRFGGADKRAAKFFGGLDHFYFSTFVDNRSDGLKSFLRAEYLGKGAALFGRGTSEELDDFRKAASGKLDNLNDFAVETIVQSSVQRVRNYAHFGSLSQAEVEYARIVVIEDGKCTTSICPTLDGKLVKVSVASATVERLSKLEPGDYALELYKSDLGRAFASDPVGYVKGRFGDEHIDDDLVAEGRGFPPFHPRCRCRVEGRIEK